jgi:transketolase
MPKLGLNMKYTITYMEKTQITSELEQSSALRILSADAVERANSGHPGLPLGFSDVFTVLCNKYLKYNPKDPVWHARDRLVLSAGHGSMLLYSFFHLSGYDGYDIEQIKNFRQVGYNTPGHPEYHPELGIETTTGPLGQGFANAVGMAIAQKKYHENLGSLMDYKIYVICGDGCLMEGISAEAASLAGHLGLDNIVVLFDDNQITIDGSTSLSTSDDHIAKFKSMGWDSYSADGHDYESIDDALAKSTKQTKPTLIAFRTKIGFGAGKKEGSESSHGAALGKESIEILRKNLNWQNEPFEIPTEIYSKWQNAWRYNEKEYLESKEKLAKISDKQQEFLKLPNIDFLKESIAIYNSKTNEPEATRVSAGKIIEILQKFSNKVIVGSADLSHSNSLYNKFSKPITKSDFSGNFIHFGVRENAMAAIMNGLATQGFLPICGTFLVFSDYMRPSMRLSALMKLQVIYIMTHDSIGVGEDGPTHQPIEHLVSLRAMPNLRVFRPCDMQEVEASMNRALSFKHSTSVLALSRQKLPQINITAAKFDKALKGAYVINSEYEKVDVSIWASGSEVEIAIAASKLLTKSGIKSAVISVPSIELFLEQDQEYINSLLSISSIKCAVEAASALGWERIIGNDGIFVGMDSFGASGTSSDLFSYFGITAPEIMRKILEKIN